MVGNVQTCQSAGSIGSSPGSDLSEQRGHVWRGGQTVNGIDGVASTADPRASGRNSRRSLAVFSNLKILQAAFEIGV